MENQRVLDEPAGGETQNRRDVRAEINTTRWKEENEFSTGSSESELSTGSSESEVQVLESDQAEKSGQAIIEQECDQGVLVEEQQQSQVESITDTMQKCHQTSQVLPPKVRGSCPDKEIQNLLQQQQKLEKLMGEVEKLLRDVDQTDIERTAEPERSEDRSGPAGLPLTQNHFSTFRGPKLHPRKTSNYPTSINPFRKMDYIYERNYLTSVKSLGEEGSGHLHLMQDRNMLVVKKVLSYCTGSELDSTDEYFNTLALGDKRTFLTCYGGSLFIDKPSILYKQYFPSCTLDEYFQRHQVTDYLLRHIFQQIINGMDELLHLGIIHRDITPSNILINANNEVKITQLSYSVNKVPCTGFFGTIGYAAPEVLAQKYKRNPQPYHHSCDMYSVGAIMYNILIGHVPGYSSMDVLDESVELEELRSFLTSGHPVVESGVVFPNDLNPLLKDLLKGLLDPNPTRRLKPKEALEHPYFIQVGEFWAPPTITESQQHSVTTVEEATGMQDLTGQVPSNQQDLTSADSTLITSAPVHVYQNTEETDAGIITVMEEESVEDVPEIAEAGPSNIDNNSQNAQKGGEPEKRKKMSAWRRFSKRFRLSGKSKTNESEVTTGAGGNIITNPDEDTTTRNDKKGCLKRCCCCCC